MINIFDVIYNKFLFLFVSDAFKPTKWSRQCLSIDLLWLNFVDYFYLIWICWFCQVRFGLGLVREFWSCLKNLVCGLLRDKTTVPTIHKQSVDYFFVFYCFLSICINFVANFVGNIFVGWRCIYLSQFGMYLMFYLQKRRGFLTSWKHEDNLHD